MKIQDLAIIFVVIIIPISLVLSIFTQYQMKTINTQTLYDTKLTSATYDAIKAFQLNSINEDYSDLAGSKLRGLEASIVTFRNSLKSAFELNGYTEDELNNYIPALVYTLYDGFYIYSPYENTHNEDGTRKTGELESLYGLKPYISYSCRYVRGADDFVITYSLDNYIQIQGTINGKYVNDEGYLIEGIEIDASNNVKYNEITIGTECLTEWLPVGTGGSLVECKYAKVNGTKYYLLGDMVFSIKNGTIGKQSGNADKYKTLINQNSLAQSYYKNAKEFTAKVLGTGTDDYNLSELTWENAIDEVIIESGADKGKIEVKKVWEGNTTKIFKSASGVNIENELSNFNQHRLAIIRHKIETNLAIAISNYNDYSGATNEFQMPELKEDEWDYIINNISLISFLQGLPIGGKVYNGYTIVTNSETEDVVLEENIYILGNDNYYHRVGDKKIEEGSSSTPVGARINLDFKRQTVFSNDGTIQLYYYPVRGAGGTTYDASYDSIVTQNNMTTFDDIYTYIDSQKNAGNTELAQIFYTALGREREAMYRSTNISNPNYANGVLAQ